MKRRLFWAITIILLLVGTAFSMANDLNQDRLFTLFRSENSAIPGLFDASFLAQVPAEKLLAVLDTYKNTLGKLMDVSGQNGAYNLVFEKGTAPAKITLNENGKIIGLWFGTWVLQNDTPEKVLSAIKNLPGKTSVCIIKNNKDVLLAYHEDEAMAVGSSFKLYVLKALYDAVRGKKLSWDRPVPLNNKNKSLPTGILQNWPEGNPVTVKTLSNLMISISDNTATDHLIDCLGREAVERYVSGINKPFVKTGELFKLKYSSNCESREKFLKGTESERRKILQIISGDNLPPVTNFTTPRFIEELEWFFSTRELCKIIFNVKDCDEIRINPGLAIKEDWYLAGFKGGSEPGVLQYTHILQKDKGGDIYTISITANNKDVLIQEAALNELTMKLILMIKDGKI